MSFLSSTTSSGDLTKDRATRSTPSSMPKARSSRSLGVMAEMGSITPGRLMPLWELRAPPTITRQMRESGVFSITLSSRAPSASSTVAPTGVARTTSGVLTEHSWPLPVMGRLVRVKVSPGTRVTGSGLMSPSLILGPARSWRMATGRPAFAAAALIMS